jgi:hypothetical protein
LNPTSDATTIASLPLYGTSSDINSHITTPKLFLVLVSIHGIQGTCKHLISLNDWCLGVFQEQSLHSFDIRKK